MLQSSPPDRGWDSSLLPCPFSSLTFRDWWSCGPEASRFEKMWVLRIGWARDEWKDVYYIYHIGLKGVMKSLKKWTKTGKALGGSYYNANCLLPEIPTKTLGKHKQPWNQKFHTSQKGLWKGKDFCSHELLEVPNEAVKSWNWLQLWQSCLFCLKLGDKT